MDNAEVMWEALRALAIVAKDARENASGLREQLDRSIFARRSRRRRAK